MSLYLGREKVQNLAVSVQASSDELSTLIGSHINDTNNPHQVTIEQLGALPLTGGVMAGPITLNADPTTALQAATKQYVDAHKVDTSGLLQLNAANQMGSSGKITMASSYTPTGSYDLITKTYMENNTIDKCYIIATSAPTDAASKKKFWINSSKGNGTINYWTGSVWKEISASYT